MTQTCTLQCTTISRCNNPNILGGLRKIVQCFFAKRLKILKAFVRFKLSKNALLTYFIMKTILYTEFVNFVTQIKQQNTLHFPGIFPVVPREFHQESLGIFAKYSSGIPPESSWQFLQEFLGYSFMEFFRKTHGNSSEISPRK